MSEEFRKAELDIKVRDMIVRGWHVESQSEHQAVMAKGRRPNHVLHLLLSVFTLGLWIPVWILLSLAKHEQRWVITV